MESRERGTHIVDDAHSKKARQNIIQVDPSLSKKIYVFPLMDIDLMSLLIRLECVQALGIGALYQWVRIILQLDNLRLKVSSGTF